MSELREFRERQGWTLAEVTGLTGLSKGYLSLIERNLREPSPAMKVRIARGVGASVAELFPPAEHEAVNA
ncbi:MAG: helix-turn-helix domain-containing protein [Streptosporangiaceae bacterium]